MKNIFLFPSRLILNSIRHFEVHADRSISHSGYLKLCKCDSSFFPDEWATKNFAEFQPEGTSIIEYKGTIEKFKSPERHEKLSLLFEVREFNKEKDGFPITLLTHNKKYHYIPSFCDSVWERICDGMKWPRVGVFKFKFIPFSTGVSL